METGGKLVSGQPVKTYIVSEVFKRVTVLMWVHQYSRSLLFSP